MISNGCLLFLLSCLQTSTCLKAPPVHSGAGSHIRAEQQNNRGMKMNQQLLQETERRDQETDGPTSGAEVAKFPARPHVLQRKLLQTSGAAVPFSPLKVLSNGEPCLLFQARKLSVRFDQQKPLDLTERAFSPLKSVDISQSVCDKDKATLVMRFGDVEDVRGLFIRLHLSNSFSQSRGQRWFSVDSLSLLYNVSEEVVFNISDIYAPSSSSYHCLHVSSLQRLSALLRPCTEHAHRWAVTFTHFQIQAFNVSSGRFSPPTDCSTVVTPAILMGLVMSLILLLVLAYALHMVVHLKDIDHNQEHKDNVYSPQNFQQPEHCSREDVTLTNVL